MTTSYDGRTSNGDYEAILRTENVKYYFYLKELQIIAKGDNIGAAHNELLRKKMR